MALARAVPSSHTRPMPISTNRSVGARLTTSAIAAVVGAGAGFTIGLFVAAILAAVLEPRISTDGEGWAIIMIWVGGAVGGTAMGAVVGIVLGYRRPPRPPVPARPDVQLDRTPS